MAARWFGRLGLWLCAWCAVAVPPARAQDREGPEHDKLVTFSASPVEARTAELELMYEPTVALHGTGSLERTARREDHSLTLAATWGVLEDLDVRAEAGWGSAYDAAYGGDLGAGRRPSAARGAGLTDTDLMARWRVLHRPGEGLEVALRPGVVIPTGAHATGSHPGLSQEHWSLEAGLLATQDAGPFTANAELTWSLPVGGARGVERGELRAGLAGGWQALPWLQPELELRYERGYRASAPPSDALIVIGGLGARLSASVAVAAGVKYTCWGRDVEQEAGGAFSLKWTP